MRKSLLIFTLFILTFSTKAQIDSTLMKHHDKDTTVVKLNMDALYSRPFLKNNKIPVSLGGYFDMNYQYLGTDGITDGHEFQFRRLSLFLASSISKRVKFLCELEFENDKDEQLEGHPMEIGIEYAALDLEFHPLLNFRSGIILNPIGAFNQNHDGPKWEFANRPIAMTELLPATFSNAGLGFYGKRYTNKWMLGYECYLTNGLDNSIIDNDKNKTYIPHAKENSARFVTSTSGSPLVTGKIAIRHNTIGEIGLSYMGGIYNAWKKDGSQIDSKRRCDIAAIDFNTSIPKLKTTIIAEYAFVFVQLPSNYFEAFGNKQSGGFIDIIHSFYNGKIGEWEKATLNASVRLEYADWNIGTFQNNGGNKGDELWAITPSLSLRPTPQTVLRLNYLYQQQKDVIGNPPAITGGVLLGFSSYF